MNNLADYMSGTIRSCWYTN